MVHEISRRVDPLRLPLGASAFGGVTTALRERLAALEPLADLARSIAFDAIPEHP
ncbi:hypothetical protein [Amycolatopsis sp. NPDC051903]|uniref:hypothetical protein n=1 Tax=Amycolatopsis sp. NPDC051903 TaxID=3363936 RepID=UPI0037B12846